MSNQRQPSGPQFIPPIMIVAPTARCGTTLLQRLINSTGNTIVYGENFLMVEMMAEHARIAAMNLDHKVSTSKALRDKLKGGTYEEDMSLMFPDYLQYNVLVRRSWLVYFDFYSRESLRNGYIRWGIKHQVRFVPSFLQFYQNFASAKFIFVYRNIIDVAKSHKARFGDLKGPDDFAEFGARWAGNYLALRKLNGPNCLHVEHSDLVSHPGLWISNIENHCEISGIDRKVMDNWINVSSFQDVLTPEEAQAKYKKPIELSDAELEALVSRSGETAREFGYRME